MANILLTQECVRHCPYCFAKKHMRKSKKEILKWDDLIYIADFFEASNEKHISLLGGEPTLHPFFLDYVLYLIKRNFHVNVFTSGILRNESLLDLSVKFLPLDSINELSFVCNINEPDVSSKTELSKIENFLKVFNKLTAVSFNIYKLDFDLSFIIDIIDKFNLKRHIRLGLAHPIPKEKNLFINKEHFLIFANSISNYFDILDEKSISIGFDCGFPMCIFNDNQLGKLYKITHNHMNFSCGPAIDIGPDMNVWSCFPLSNYKKKSFYDFDSLEDIRVYYRNMLNEIKSKRLGIFDKCVNCNYRERNLCEGGCAAHLIM